MAGEEKAVEETIRVLWKLKREAGVSLWFTGHTKRKSVTDIVTGDEYETLTSNMTAKYFNAIKTKLHILGVASVDRDIEKIKVKQKVGADKLVGKVKNQSRVITFRDDNFNIDSKSRFADIADRISLDADEFIKALKDAIEASFGQQKGKKSIEQVKVEQVAEKEEKLEQAKEVRDDVDYVDEAVNASLLKKITTYIKGEEAEDDVVEDIMTIFAETGKKSSAVDEIPTSVYRKAVALFE